MELKNTFVLRTDDNEFKQAINGFLSDYCNDKPVNFAVYELNDVGAAKVMDIVLEEE